MQRGEGRTHPGAPAMPHTSPAHPCRMGPRPQPNWSPGLPGIKGSRTAGRSVGGGESRASRRVPCLLSHGLLGGPLPFWPQCPSVSGEATALLATYCAPTVTGRLPRTLEAPETGLRALPREGVNTGRPVPGPAQSCFTPRTESLVDPGTHWRLPAGPRDWGLDPDWERKRLGGRRNRSLPPTALLRSLQGRRSRVRTEGLGLRWEASEVGMPRPARLLREAALISLPEPS